MTDEIIKPTVGRVVHYYPPSYVSSIDFAPLCALIAHVWDDHCVNLAVFDENGAPYGTPPTSVRLVQPGENEPTGERYCTWMPYQLTKSYGSESGEKAAGDVGRNLLRALTREEAVALRNLLGGISPLVAKQELSRAIFTKRRLTRDHVDGEWKALYALLMRLQDEMESQGVSW